jgi:hypothetical protein
MPTSAAGSNRATERGVGRRGYRGACVCVCVWRQAVQCGRWERAPDALPDASSWPTWGALRERILTSCKQVRESQPALTPILPLVALKRKSRSRETRLFLKTDVDDSSPSSMPHERVTSSCSLVSSPPSLTAQRFPLLGKSLRELRGASARRQRAARMDRTAFITHASHTHTHIHTLARSSKSSQHHTSSAAQLLLGLLDAVAAHVALDSACVGAGR